MLRCGVLRVEPRRESRRMMVSGGSAAEEEEEDGAGEPLRTERRTKHSWASTTCAGVQLGAEAESPSIPPVVEVENDVIEWDEGEDGPAASAEAEFARA